MKKHTWTIGKWATLLGLLASLAIILDSKSFRDFIAPWSTANQRFDKLDDKIDHLGKQVGRIEAVLQINALAAQQDTYITNRPMARYGSRSDN